MTISRIGLALASTIVAATVTGAGLTVTSLALSSGDLLASAEAPQASFPQVNREAKQDRLMARAEASQAATYQLASAASTDVVETQPASVRAAAPAIEAPGQTVAAIESVKLEPLAKPKPAAPKLPSAAMLRDNQIASLKERLKLSAAQERHWPAVEVALRGVLRQVYEAKRKGDGSVDPNSPEVQRLKSAAMPLLMQMRDDQKQEVRQLAYVIGLADVAAML